MDKEINEILQLNRVLTQEEEYKLFTYYRKHRTKELRNQIAMKNQSLIYSVIKGFKNSNMEESDMLQEGFIGLMKAVEKFDPDRGTKFSTCAFQWIRGEITRKLSDCGHTIRVPVNIVDDYTLLSNIRDKKGSDVSLLECAKEAGISEKRAAFVIENIEGTAKIVSLDEPVRNRRKKSDEKEQLYGDVVSYRENEYERIEKEMNEESLRAAVRKMLPENLAKIIILKYGLDGDAKTLKEIGNMYGVTGQSISKKERKAIKILKLQKNRKLLASYF